MSQQGYDKSQIDALRATPHRYTRDTLYLSVRNALDELATQRRLVRQTIALLLQAGEPVSNDQQGFLTPQEAKELFISPNRMYTDEILTTCECYIEGEGMPDAAGIYVFAKRNAYRIFDILPDPARPRLEGALDREARSQAEQATRAYYEGLTDSFINGPYGWDYSSEEMAGVKYNEDGNLIVGSIYSQIEHYDSTSQIWRVATWAYVGPNLELDPTYYAVSRTPEPEQKWIVLPEEAQPSQ